MGGAAAILCLTVSFLPAAADVGPAGLHVEAIRAGGSLLAPVGPVFRELGFRQSWDAVSDTVRLRSAAGTLSLKPGDQHATFMPAQGEAHTVNLPVAPRYVGRRLHAPVEALWALIGLQTRLITNEPFRLAYDVEGKLMAFDLPGADAAAEIAEAKGSVVLLETTRGNIYLELFDGTTPVTAGSFLELVGRGFYDGLSFHRVIADFMIQGGDPAGDGTGGPGFTIPDEADRGLKHVRGSLSMAKTAAPNTGGSQFFICHVPCPHLDGVHTVFGQCIKGQEVVDAIRRGDEITRAVIVKEGPQAQQAIAAALQARVPQR